jgi:hypothetical protein
VRGFCGRRRYHIGRLNLIQLIMSLDVKVEVVAYGERFRGMNEMGWGCGYVIIPTGHPILIKLLDDDGQYFYLQPEEFDQEITLSNKVDDNFYKIGFDTAHIYNNASHDEAWVTKKAEELKEIVDAYTLEDANNFYKFKMSQLEQESNSLVTNLLNL